MNAIRTPLSLLILAASVVSSARPAHAEDVVEPSTEHKFPSTAAIDGKPYSLLGVGVRKKAIIKVYGMGLYGEDAGAKAAAPAINKLSGEARARAVADTPFAKFGILHFVRDVDWGKIQDAYKDGLAAMLDEKAPADVRHAAQDFIGLFSKDIKDGQEIHLMTDESGQITVEIAGQKKVGPKSPQLAKALWYIYLGPEPISGSLREGLVSRTELLGK